MFEDWPKLSSQKKLKKVVLIFIIAFGLNFLWENLHAGLYLHYQGQTITQLILIRAAIFDALFITALFWLIVALNSTRKNLWLWMLTISLLFAITLEVYALQTDRWTYQKLMPIVPWFKTGLTPTVQLAITALISLWAVSQKRKKEKTSG